MTDVLRRKTGIQPVERTAKTVTGPKCEPPNARKSCIDSQYLKVLGGARVKPQCRGLVASPSCGVLRQGPRAPVRSVTPMDWRHRAACLDEDPELFFPIGNTGPALLQIEEAKQVCRRCEVRDACLQWALEAGQDHGVWGGLSEDERRALKRRAARARIRTA
jgi:WhiB family redox-sensing transcriptional regulator